jgi:hypothetical protein
MALVIGYGMLFPSDTVSVSIQIVLFCAILLAAYYSYLSMTTDHPYSGFPIATLPGEGLGPKESFFKDAQKTIAANIESQSGPFQIITGTGPKIVLPNRFADELRARPELDFNEAFRKDFFAHYHGFEAFRASMDHPELIPSVLKTKVSQSLGLVINHLVDETTFALQHLYGGNEEWQSIAVKKQNLDLIGRLSSRIFLGKPVCRNEQWLKIAKNHTGEFS